MIRKNILLANSCSIPTHETAMQDFYVVEWDGGINSGVKIATPTQRTVGVSLIPGSSVIVGVCLFLSNHINQIEETVVERGLGRR